MSEEAKKTMTKEQAMEYINTRIDNFINNTRTKHTVIKAMTEAGIEPEKVNYEDVRQILHEMQNHLCKDLLNMVQRRKGHTDNKDGDMYEFTDKEIGETYGWFDWACLMEAFLCNKDKRVVFMEVHEGSPMWADTEYYYTEKPLDEHEELGGDDEEGDA